MRDYSKVSPRFWLGTTGRQLRAEGPDVQLVALYLVTAPNSNMIGLYAISTAAIANDTGLSSRKVQRALKRLGEIRFSEYDDHAQVVWVLEMARFQVSEKSKDAEALKPEDKRCKGVQREYDLVPDNRMLAAFGEKYASRFHLTRKRRSTGSDGLYASTPASPLQGPSKALRSQEQEQEQEHAQAKEHAHEPIGNGGGVIEIPYQRIFELYNEIMTPGLAKANELTPSRRQAIKEAWNGSPTRRTLEWWRQYFEEASGNAFLNGDGPYSTGFRPNLDYLLKDGILSSVYDKGMARLAQEAGAAERVTH